MGLEQSFKHLDFSPYALSEQSHFSNCQKCVPANTFWKVQRRGRNKSHLILLENTCKGQMQELTRQTLFNRGRNKPTQQAGWSNFPDRGRQVTWLSDLESENIIRNTVEETKRNPRQLWSSADIQCCWWGADDHQVSLIAESEQVWPGGNPPHPDTGRTCKDHAN